MRAAQETMQDHKRIRCHGGARRFLPRDTLEVHLASKVWLEASIAPAWESIYKSFWQDDLPVPTPADWRKPWRAMVIRGCGCGCMAIPIMR
jgi:hypothetical protein